MLLHATESNSDPVSKLVDSCESSRPFLECNSPDRNYECENLSDPSSMSAASSSVASVPIPVGSDGLPDEDTISFLFDHVSHEQVTARAQEQPAYKKLAALRERVLARLNRKDL